MSINSGMDPFKDGRFYHLPIYHLPLTSAESMEGQWHAVSGGLARSAASRQRWERAVRKARRGAYSSVVLPPNSVMHQDFSLLLRAIQAAELQPVYQIPLSLFHSLWAQHEALLAIPGMSFEIIVDELVEDFSEVERLQKNYATHFTVPGLRKAGVWKNLKKIPSFFVPDLYFYFPYHGDKKILFKAHEIGERLEEFQKFHPGAVCRSPLGVDIYEPRIEEWQDLEPLLDPLCECRLNSSPRLSVVIPAFNNGTYVANTLRHLQAQTFSKDDYEVIVVDDGSSDSTSEQLLAVAQELSLCLRIIYYPRLKPRAMGDSQFRAGLARNLGVKAARGDLLVFLDSDIIVPPTFLETTVRLHERPRLVQWRRDYLSQQVNSSNICYGEVEPERDCFIPEGGYWHGFYEKAARETWMAQADRWKYVCTYALSLPRDLFCRSGWFRKTYCFYGFEDTDLGYRLDQKNVELHFHDEPVYHLFHETGRSEYKNSFMMRQNLLKNTAKIFYHNNLAPDIYRVFKYLLKPWF